MELGVGSSLVLSEEHRRDEREAKARCSLGRCGDLLFRMECGE